MLVEIGLIIITSLELVPGILLFPGDTLVEKTKNFRALLSAKIRKS